MAADGFVSRAFESMLKECAGKKHPDLQKMDVHGALGDLFRVQLKALLA